MSRRRIEAWKKETEKTRKSITTRPPYLAQVHCTEHNRSQRIFLCSTKHGLGGWWNGPIHLIRSHFARARCVRTHRLGIDHPPWLNVVFRGFFAPHASSHKINSNKWLNWNCGRKFDKIVGGNEAIHRPRFEFLRRWRASWAHTIRLLQRQRRRRHSSIMPLKSSKLYHPSVDDVAARWTQTNDDRRPNPHAPTTKKML